MLTGFQDDANRLRLQYAHTHIRKAYIIVDDAIWNRLRTHNPDYFILDPTSTTLDIQPLVPTIIKRRAYTKHMIWTRLVKAEVIWGSRSMQFARELHTRAAVMLNKIMVIAHICPLRNAKKTPRAHQIAICYDYHAMFPLRSTDCSDYLYIYVIG